MKLLSKKYIRLPLIIAVIAALVLAGIDQIFLTNHSKYVNASIELLYSSAADGLAPNGESFVIDNIESDDNLQAAITAAGLDISVKELKDNITIQGVYPKDLAEQMSKFDSLLDLSTSREVSTFDYNPTIFSITLNNGFEKQLSKANLVKLFECIIDQYKVFFANAYSAKIDWAFVEDSCNSDDQEYLRDVENMQYEVSLMKSYADKLASMDSTFEVDGVGFTDFASSCGSFGNNTLSSMLADIHLNGISKDAGKLERIYTLQLMESNAKKEELTENISHIDELMLSYSKDSSVYLSSNVSDAAVSSNSNKTYETLVGEKKDLTRQLISVNSEISKLEESIGNIQGQDGEVKASDFSKFETSLENAKKKLDSLKQQFTKLCEAFNKQYASEEVLKISAAAYYGANTIPVAFVKQCIKFGIVTVGLAVVYILCYEVAEELKKKKANC